MGGSDILSGYIAPTLPAGKDKQKYIYFAGALKALSYYIIYREKEGLIPSQSTFHILVVPNAHFNWFVLVWFSVTGTYIVVLSCSVWFGWLMILSEHFTEWREGSLQCCVIGSVEDKQLPGR